MTPELTLDIQKEGERYATVISADGFEDERISPDPEKIKRILSKSDLIESFITDHHSHRFASDLIKTGLEMYGLFLEPYSKLAEFLQRNASRAIKINIQTNQHEISNLPWELLYTPEHQFLAVSPRVKLLRTRGKNRENNGKDLPPGPLRILFMACSPDGAGPLLNYEKEEEIIINAVADLKRNKDLVIDIAQGGTLEELKSMLMKEEYHVVHLTGHGDYDDREEMGYLSMERESGLEDRVSAKRLAETLLDKHTVRLVFLSACYTGAQKSAGTGLANSLLDNGIPIVIGMKHPVAEYAATAMSEVFYRHLTLKCTAGQALHEARKRFEERYKGRFQWAIPALFCQDGDTSIIDWNKPGTPVKPGREPSTILYGKVKHLKEGFVGRRREARECMKILRKGTPPAICITGAGGTGKSTLASRLTDRLHGSGFMVVPIYGEVTPDSFIQHTINSLVGEKENEHINSLRELIDYNDKIIYIVTNIIGTRETVFLFDNFEDNLKQSAEFQEFKNPYWEETFRRLLDQLPHTGSRAMITCRYTIPNLSGELLFQTPLKEMTEPETKKLIFFNEDYTGIGLDRIKEIYETIGGNPKALKDIGKVIAEQGKWDNIKASLETVSKGMREFTIFKELYSFLNGEEQQFFRKISVYHGPIEIDAIACQEPDAKKAKGHIQRLIDYSLLQWYEDHIYNREYYEVHPLNRGYMEREWQAKGEMTEEMKTAHQRAAEYYLGFTGRGLDLDKLTRAVHHLGAGKEYNRMADTVNSYSNQMILHGFWDEGLYLNQRVLDERSQIEKRLLAPTYNNIGAIYSNKGEWDKALEYYLKDEKITIEVGDRAGLGPTYNNIGLIYDNKGEWDKALEYCLKSEKIRIEVGDRAGLVFTYFGIGATCLGKNDIKNGEDNIILGGYIAMTQGMKHELSRMEWALGPIIERIGKDTFIEKGKSLCKAKGLSSL